MRPSLSHVNRMKGSIIISDNLLQHSLNKHSPAAMKRGRSWLATSPKFISSRWKEGSISPISHHLVNIHIEFHTKNLGAMGGFIFLCGVNKKKTERELERERERLFNNQATVKRGPRIALHGQ